VGVAWAGIAAVGRPRSTIVVRAFIPANLSGGTGHMSASDDGPCSGGTGDHAQAPAGAVDRFPHPQLQRYSLRANLPRGPRSSQAPTQQCVGSSPRPPRNSGAAIRKQVGSQARRLVATPGRLQVRRAIALPITRERKRGALAGAPSRWVVVGWRADRCCSRDATARWRPQRTTNRSRWRSVAVERAPKPSRIPETIDASRRRSTSQLPRRRLRQRGTRRARRSQTPSP